MAVPTDRVGAVKSDTAISYDVAPGNVQNDGARANDEGSNAGPSGLKSDYAIYNVTPSVAYTKSETGTAGTYTTAEIAGISEAETVIVDTANATSVTLRVSKTNAVIYDPKENTTVTPDGTISRARSTNTIIVDATNAGSVIVDATKASVIKINAEPFYGNPNCRWCAFKRCSKKWLGSCLLCQKYPRPTLPRIRNLDFINLPHYRKRSFKFLTCRNCFSKCLKCPKWLRCRICPLKCPSCKIKFLKCPKCNIKLPICLKYLRCKQCPLKCPSCKIKLPSCPKCKINLPKCPKCKIKLPKCLKCTVCRLKCPSCKIKCPKCRIKLPKCPKCKITLPKFLKCTVCPLKCPSCKIKCASYKIKCPKCRIKLPKCPKCPKCKITLPKFSKCLKCTVCPFKCLSCKIKCPKCKITLPKCPKCRVGFLKCSRCKIKFPKCLRCKINLPKCPKCNFKMPSCPKCKINLPNCPSCKIKLPKCKIKVPKCKIRWPSCPKVQLPKCPSFKILSLKFPKCPNFKTRLPKCPKCKIKALKCPKCRIHFPKCHQCKKRLRKLSRFRTEFKQFKNKCKRCPKRTLYFLNDSLLPRWLRRKRSRPPTGGNHKIRVYVKSDTYRRKEWFRRCPKLPKLKFCLPKCRNIFKRTKSCLSTTVTQEQTVAAYQRRRESPKIVRLFTSPKLFLKLKYSLLSKRFETPPCLCIKEAKKARRPKDVRKHARKKQNEECKGISIREPD